MSDELTKDQAAARAGVSTKAIERWVRAGKLDQRFRPQAGTSPVAIYLAEDIDRIAATRQPGPPKPFLVPDGLRPAVNGNGHGSQLPAISHPPSELLSSGEELLKALMTALVHSMSQTSQTSAYVDKTEALALSGVSAGELRRAVKAGEVKVRGRRYRRTDLEAL